MRNILITLMFDGADFHGWQVQDNAVTIQQTLQNTIEKILGKRENIIGCSRTDSGVHANMFCTSKEYKYLILNSDYRNPFLFKRALYYPYYIDTDMLNSEAQDFIGTHDFSAFCAAGSSVEGKIRTVKNASVIRNKEIIEVTFEADGFLYNMVRIMVGTLLDINRGKIVPGSIPQIIESKDRNQAGATAAPEGLYLNRVNYD